MLKPEDAWSIVIRQEDAAERLISSAQASDWLADEIARGASVSPAATIRAARLHAEAARASAGAHVLTATLIAQAYGLGNRPPPLAWWRRWCRRGRRWWRALRGKGLETPA